MREARSIILGVTLVFAGFPVAAQHEEGGHDHSAHMKAMEEKNYETSVESYSMPDVTLENQHGETIALKELLEPDQSVAVNFIFTTCTTICPVLTATFSKMKSELDEEAEDLLWVSISIDPEYDTPQVLKKYADRVGIDDRWQLLTGSMDDIIAVQEGFDAYAGDKMNHRPLSFIRAPGGEGWLRVAGLASGSDLAAEYRLLAGE